MQKGAVMSLNIKNKEVYQLASELAQLTGRSMTAIVLDALRKERGKLALQENEEATVDELMAIGRRCAAHVNQPAASTEHGDMLYDKNGMPR